MKLLCAHIQNFRLLKNISFQFSTDSNRNMTLVRAANESGKTTLLTALQWGLFGNEALPDHGKDFRLSPIDTSSGEKTSVTISVEMDYEVPTRVGTKKYRLIRSVIETVHGVEWKRSNVKVDLLHLKANGADPMNNAEIHIRPYLPQELREVFFTDGDRALSFIEGSKGDQMKRVEGAIRSLLGLTVVEEALNHTRQAYTNINKKIQKNTSNQQELQTVSTDLATLESQLSQLEEQLRRTKENTYNLDNHKKETDQQISEALLKGNREELEQRRQTSLRHRQSAEKDADQAASDHANLFKSELLGRHLLANPFTKAKLVLDRLYEQGKIPKHAIPVLVDRLNQPVCICGETLDPNDSDGRRHRTYIQNLIEENRNPDAIQGKVTALYFSAQEMLEPVQERTWSNEYNIIFERRQSAKTSCREFGEEEADIEARIAKLPDVDTKQLQKTLNHYRKQYEKSYGEQIRLTTELNNIQEEIKHKEAERENLLKHDKKGMEIQAKLNVARDLQQVLSKALETMKTRELEKVSDSMNALFLNMIGADPLQESIITRAFITPDFRIAVFGRHDHPLDPSQDLNGASRRALTIAFILALTHVSEVKAPNVIDTPLGMMSGYVKQAVLQLASRHSSQLILFLTHSEIAGCEDILDQYAGQICTLTNPAHYPKILVNDPGTKETGILQCNCNHKGTCKVCERHEVAAFTE